MTSGSHAGLAFQPGGGVRPGGEGRDVGCAGADDEDDNAAQISAIFSASAADFGARADDADDAAAAAAVASGADGAGVAVVVVAVGGVVASVAMPRWANSDLRLTVGVDEVVDTAVAAGVAVAADDDDAAEGLRRQDGYDLYPDAAQSVAAFSAAAVAAADDGAADVDAVEDGAVAFRGPGVDEAFGGARTTTEDILEVDAALSIFFFSFSALLSIASLKFLALLSPGLSPLSIASFLARFLSDFV